MKNLTAKLTGAIVLASASTLAWVGGDVGKLSTSIAWDRPEVVTMGVAGKNMPRALAQNHKAVVVAVNEDAPGQEMKEEEDEILPPGLDMLEDREEASLIQNHKAVVVAVNEDAPGQEMKEEEDENLPPGLDMLEDREEASLTQNHKATVVAANEEAPGQEMKEEDDEDLPPGLEKFEESSLIQNHKSFVVADADKEGQNGQGEAEGHENGANFPGA